MRILMLTQVIFIISLFLFYMAMEQLKMSNSPHRRKICEIQCQKQNYQRHLDRLQKLKEGHGPQQLKRNLEERRLYHTINQMRKIHSFNRQFRIKQMKSVQRNQKSKQKIYSKIKSVIKEDISKLTLAVATKHKPNFRPLLEENQKILNRILSVKPKVSFQSGQKSQKLTNKLPYIAENDFSKIYEKYQLNQRKKQIVKLSLGKCHKNIKLCLQFNTANLQTVFKDISSFYVLQAVSGSKKSRTDKLVLGDLQNKKIIIRISEKNYIKDSIYLRFIQILDKKQLVKGVIECTSCCSNNNSQYKNSITQCNESGINENKIEQSVRLVSTDVLSCRGKQQMKWKLEYWMKIVKKKGGNVSERDTKIGLQTYR